MMRQGLTGICRADHERVKSQVDKQRLRADKAERALEPLRHNIRQLTAEVEAKAEEIRVVSTGVTWTPHASAAAGVATWSCGCCAAFSHLANRQAPDSLHGFARLCRRQRARSSGRSARSSCSRSTGRWTWRSTSACRQSLRPRRQSCPRCALRAWPSLQRSARSLQRYLFYFHALRLKVRLALFCNACHSQRKRETLRSLHTGFAHA